LPLSCPRGLVFVQKFFGGQVPTPSSKGAEEVAELGASVSAKVQEYISLMEKMKLRDGIRVAMAVSADGNKFFTDTEPFKVVKTDKEHAATLVAAGKAEIFVGIGSKRPVQGV
jgi:methionyl-tRNA synthetase